jgi:hypothetical protein
MWDDRRKAVPTDLSADSSGKDNVGALPFMALDLLSSEGRRGEIPRRYRHEAESFAWSLIFLYFATVEDVGGNNRTRDPHPLQRWFTDWEISHDAKKGLGWRDRDIAGIPLAHPNTRGVARALHNYWLERYNQQFPKHDLGSGSRVNEMFGVETSQNPPEAHLSYREPEDDTVFREVLARHEMPLAVVPLKEVQDDLFRMLEKFQQVDWDA